MSQGSVTGTGLTPSPIYKEMSWGSDARSAPTTPSNREAVIDRSKVDPNIVKAAEGMEALFLDHMMQAMRKTVPKSEHGLNNGATEIYQGMLDSEYAKSAAQAGGYGLADLVIAYMDPQSYNAKRVVGPTEVPVKVAGNPEARTGGTDEGRESRQLRPEQSGNTRDAEGVSER